MRYTVVSLGGSCQLTHAVFGVVVGERFGQQQPVQVFPVDVVELSVRDFVFGRLDIGWRVVAFEKLFVSDDCRFGCHVLVVWVVVLAELFEDVVQRVELGLDTRGPGSQTGEGELLRQEVSEEC